MTLTQITQALTYSRDAVCDNCHNPKCGVFASDCKHNPHLRTINTILTILNAITFILKEVTP